MSTIATTIRETRSTRDTRIAREAAASPAPDLLVNATRARSRSHST